MHWTLLSRWEAATDKVPLRACPFCEAQPELRLKTSMVFNLVMNESRHFNPWRHQLPGGTPAFASTGLSVPLWRDLFLDLSHSHPISWLRNTIKIMSNGRICYEHMPHSKILCVLVLLHLLAQQSGAPRRGPYRDWPRRNSVKVYFLSVFLRSVLGPGYASYVLWVYFEAHIGF